MDTIYSIPLNIETISQIELFALDTNDPDIRQLILRLCQEVRELNHQNKKLLQDLEWEQSPNRFKNIVARSYMSENILDRMRHTKFNTGT